jgi:DNA-3-methyladenine glycosylase II
MTRSFLIRPLGAFSLRESALFGFGQRLPVGQRGGSTDDGFDGVMRLAFCLDGYAEQVGIELRQDGAGVHGIVHGAGDLEIVQRQVARCLSLDHDGRDFEAVGRRDPVIGRLQEAAPGLRPPLFYSPYEAAAWSILSARRPASQTAAVRARLSRVWGRTFELAGEELAALPTPRQLLEVTDFPGIPPERLDRLHGVARAALRGLLDADRLLRLGPVVAASEMQRIKGIGPFYASLIVIRGTGFTDVLTPDESRSLDLIRQLYGLPDPPSQAQLEELAEPWRPFRTWCTVLIRAAGHRVLASP